MNYYRTQETGEELQTDMVENRGTTLIKNESSDMSPQQHQYHQDKRRGHSHGFSETRSFTLIPNSSSRDL